MNQEKSGGEKRKLIFDQQGIDALAIRFREVRKGAGYTKRQLAFESGVNISQLVRIERGEINPTVSTIFVISRAMNIEPEEFFKFKLPPKKED